MPILVGDSAGALCCGRKEAVEPRSKFVPRTSTFNDRVQSSFAKQTVMHLIGAELMRVLPGEVEIFLPFRHDLAQQHGFLHAGIITMIMDSACGYAALSLMPADASVLTVEFKVNLLSPAKGKRFAARGKVVKPGRTITVCSGDVCSLDFEEPKLVATMTATMMTIPGRPGVVEE